MALHQQFGAGRQGQGKRLPYQTQSHRHGLSTGREARPPAACVSLFPPTPNSEEPKKRSLAAKPGNASVQKAPTARARGGRCRPRRTARRHGMRDQVGLAARSSFRNFMPKRLWLACLAAILCRVRRLLPRRSAGTPMRGGRPRTPHAGRRSGHALAPRTVTARPHRPRRAAASPRFPPPCCPDPTAMPHRSRRRATAPTAVRVRPIARCRVRRR